MEEKKGEENLHKTIQEGVEATGGGLWGAGGVEVAARVVKEAAEVIGGGGRFWGAAGHGRQGLGS